MQRNDPAIKPPDEHTVQPKTQADAYETALNVQPVTFPIPTDKPPASIPPGVPIVPLPQILGACTRHVPHTQQLTTWVEPQTVAPVTTPSALIVLLEHNAADITQVE